MSGRSAAASLALAVLAVGAAAYLLLFTPLSTGKVALLGFLAAAAVVVAAAVVAARSGSSWNRVVTAAKDIGPLVTIVAIFVAVGFYFLERKDKIRLAFQIETQLVSLAAPESAQAPAEAPRPDEASKAVLSVRVPIENRSARRVEVQCISLFIFEPGQTSVQRFMGAPEMGLHPLSETIPNSSAAQNCGSAIEGHSPLFRWAPLQLEPNEADARYFEVLVDCARPFVRVVVELQVAPPAGRIYEGRTLVPVAGVCGSANPSNNSSTPAILVGGSDSVSSTAAR